MTSETKLQAEPGSSPSDKPRASRTVKRPQTRRLRSVDASVYRALLLEALIVHADCFPEDYRTELVRPLAEIGQELESNTVLGTWVSDKLVAMGSCVPYGDSKRQHRGRVRIVYVKKQFRRRGIATALLTELTHYVARSIDQLEVEITVKDEPVVRFFEQYGFRMFGLTPRAIRVDNRWQDTWTLIRLLR